MDEKFAIKRLKRVHDSAVRADTGSAQAVVQEYNNTLLMLKKEFRDNEFIQSMEEISADVSIPVARTEREIITPENALEKIKIKTEQISDSLELGGDFERPTEENEMPLLTLKYSPSQENRQNVHQEANPELNQNVNVESIIELVQLDPQVQNDREEMIELIKQFEKELNSENPDSGRLRQFIADAKEYSTSVAAKLAMLGLQHGAVGILGL